MRRDEARSRLFAMGRLKTGEMNRAEMSYEDQVLKPLQQAGEILWYRFEGLKLKLADRTFLTVDFAVLPRSGVLEMHDVKGHRKIYMDDAKVKMKVAAEAYPFVFKVAFAPSGRNGAWEVETI